MQKVVKEVCNFVNSISQKELEGNPELVSKLNKLLSVLKGSHLKVKKLREEERRKIAMTYLGDSLLNS